jgi:hypothetical protein
MVRIVRVIPMFESPMDDMLRSLNLGPEPFGARNEERTHAAFPIFRLWGAPSSQVGGGSSGFRVARRPPTKAGGLGNVVVRALLPDFDESTLRTHILSSPMGGKSLIISGGSGAHADGSMSEFQRTFRLPASSVSNDDAIDARFNTTSKELRVTVPFHATLRSALPHDDGVADGVSFDDEWDSLGRSLHSSSSFRSPSASSRLRGGGGDIVGARGDLGRPISPLEMMIRALNSMDEASHYGASGGSAGGVDAMAAAPARRESISPVFWRFHGGEGGGAPTIRVHARTSAPVALRPVLRDGLQVLDLERKKSAGAAASSTATIAGGAAAAATAPYARLRLPVAASRIVTDAAARSSGGVPAVATLAVDPKHVDRIPIRTEL